MAAGTLASSSRARRWRGAAARCTPPRRRRWSSTRRTSATAGMTFTTRWWLATRVLCLHAARRWQRTCGSGRSSAFWLRVCRTHHAQSNCTWLVAVPCGAAGSSAVALLQVARAQGRRGHGGLGAGCAHAGAGENRDSCASAFARGADGQGRVPCSSAEQHRRTRAAREQRRGRRRCAHRSARRRARQRVTARGSGGSQRLPARRLHVPCHVH